uniref:Transmembrane protein 159 n=1 Tax=Kryptolebias marmoratus TaxID=37003 RepID=A0A3Q3BJZ3_KRYMA
MQKRIMHDFSPSPRDRLLMRTRLGQHLSGRPFLALTLLLFSAMAALPVGLFLMFALVTIVISAVGFVFFEVFLLLVGGLTLLSVLSGIALFSLLVSVIVSTLLFTIPNLLKHYYPHHLMMRREGVNGCFNELYLIQDLIMPA